MIIALNFSCSFEARATDIKEEVSRQFVTPAGLAKFLTTVTGEHMQFFFVFCNRNSVILRKQSCNANLFKSTAPLLVYERAYGLGGSLEEKRLKKAPLPPQQTQP
jgi:hypothetical protein